MIQTFYNSAFKEGMDGTVDYSTDTFKVALVTSAYNPDYDNHSNFSDITNEVSGTGYTAGGDTIANQTTTKDNTNDQAVFDGDDVSWPNSTITARAGVLYKDTGVAGTSTLIQYLDFESDQSTTNTEFKITWSASGIIAYKVSA